MRKSLLLAATAISAVASPAWAQVEDDVDDNVIIVTAQRQAQSLQEVPIAVSAFDAQALEAQQIENASDLQLTLPNVSFTKSNFTASSFTIRGIGDLCVGVTCDSATAIHLNDAPLFNTRLFETEYFDLERVEVLRGPQGTLFGRNATSGVVNVVTAKPELGEFKGSVEGQFGNFESYQVKAMVNVPIGDSLAFRAAGFYQNRDGYTKNLFDDSRIDGRDMYAVRGSIKWEPTPDTTVDLMAYYFREDDDRLRIQKQLCQRDPTGVLGCLNNRLDFDKNNTNANFTGVLGSSEFFAITFAGTPLAGLAPSLGLNSLYGPDGHANFDEPDNVREVRTDFTPEYFTDELQLQAHIEHDFGPIQVSVTGLYQETAVDSRQDYNLSILGRDTYVTALNTISAVPTFAPVAAAIIPNGPAGQLCTSDTDTIGLGSYGGNRICADTPISLDRSNQDNTSWSIEGIVSSDFDGPFNFLLGGIYAENNLGQNSYYVNAFAIDYIVGVLGAANGGFLATPYFRNNTREFELESYGIFGEVYFDISDELKFTGGLRYNNDKKFVEARSTLASFLVPFGQTADAFESPFVGLFDADPGTPGNQIVQQRNVAFDEITGRAVLDWQFTPDNLIYLSYSRGYKSGGINPPLQPIFAVPESFGSEQIDAFEIGSKNTFAGGAFQLNATAFYYKYKDLQLSRIIARTAVNDTVDADIYGAEIEAIVRPDPDWLINMGFSYLKSKVKGDQFFSNPRDPGGGRADAVIIKDITNGANCAVVPGTAGNAAGTNAFVNAINGGLGLQPTTAFPADGNIASTGAFGICSALEAQAAAIGAGFDPAGIQVLSPGVQVNLRGNDLPQAPNVKVSAGVQYTHNFDSGWTLVPRVDIAYTGDQTGSIFNGNVNKIEGFTQANASLQLNGNDDKWFVRAFVQNIFNSNSITGQYLTDASSGLFTNIFTLDPRRYGIGAGIKF
ncbi:TonB-dependent receptor [Parasphingorhabdus litoris]|uniref:TonB-dependent receptor n=1 Tax=Parasphingorhabdus litoris TaxID=394733 RepID=A0ABP3K2P0_9SPHN|nr:TonB-dependent receptor [Parasphingorhabdus litoris]